MKALIIINSYPNGCTGTMCQTLKQGLANDFDKIFFISSFQLDNSCEFTINECSSVVQRVFALFKMRLFNLYGFGSKTITNRVLNGIKNNINSEDRIIINIHNINASLFDLGAIMAFGKEYNAQLVFTLHDCWIFTGKCPYFNISKCNGWRENACKYCTHAFEYPFALFSNTKKALRKKRDLFNDYDRISFICPSMWIYQLLSLSLLPKKNKVLIYNGIDARDFPNKTISEKHIVLAVASVWNERKGLKYINELANLIPDEFEIHVVGLNKRNKTSDRIVRHGFLSKKELDVLFESASVFVNPSLEDNFPTVNIEALSHDIPVVTFNTGGSPEAIDKETGYICRENTSEELMNGIEYVLKTIKSGSCFKRFKERFEKQVFIDNYSAYFKELLNDEK